MLKRTGKSPNEPMKCIKITSILLLLLSLVYLISQFFENNVSFYYAFKSIFGIYYLGIAVNGLLRRSYRITQSDIHIFMVCREIHLFLSIVRLATLYNFGRDQKTKIYYFNLFISEVVIWSIVSAYLLEKMRLLLKLERDATSPQQLNDTDVMIQNMAQMIENTTQQVITILKSKNYDASQISNHLVNKQLELTNLPVYLPSK
eukprot:NODE_47_length_32105_cov_1.240892.p20 type:complete len:203 gc:universal NODE_47_length_32105_cov_1.240892:22553-23161(+)